MDIVKIFYGKTKKIPPVRAVFLKSDLILFKIIQKRTTHA